MSVPIPATGTFTGSFKKAQGVVSRATEKATGVVSTAYKRIAAEAKPAKRFTEGLAMVLGSSVVALISALITNFIKDNTMLKALGWVGLGIAAILFGTGATKLYKREKETAVTHEPNEFKVSETLSRKSINALQKLKATDPTYQELQLKDRDQSRIYSNSATDSTRLRQEAFELFKNYRDALRNESELGCVLKRLDRKEGQREPIITNISEGRMNVADLQYENAMLLGYLVGSRQAKFKDDQYTRQLSDVLEDRGIPDASLFVLPETFRIVYKLGRDYDLIHRDKNNSIKDTFEKELGSWELKDLERNLRGGKSSGPSKTRAVKYLADLRDNANNLKALLGAIQYVKDNSDSSNIEDRKLADVVRAALICGLRLRVRGKDDFLTSRLDEIINGQEVPGGVDKKGLKEKLAEMDKFLERFDTEVLSKENCPYTRESLGDEKIFPSDLGMFEFTSK